MELKDIVKERYGQAARRVSSGEGLPADCCSKTSCCSGSAAASCDPITSNLYDEAQTGQIPEEALKASLGCGNPTALATAQPWRNGPRSRLGRRHRRAALGASGRTHR